MWRRWAGALLALAGLPGAAGRVSLALLEQPLTPLGAAEISALVSGSVAFAVACGLIASHALNLQWPELQVCFVRILLFTPAVVTVCILTLLWPAEEDFFELIESFWEVFVFLSFLQCLFVYCGGRRQAAKYLETVDGGLRWPCCCCFPRCCPRTSFRDGGHAVASYEWRVALFCFLKPLCDVVRVILHNLHVVPVVVNVLNGISSVATIIAMTSIMILEKKVLYGALKGLRASAKFWVIKGLVVLIVIEQRVVIGFVDNATPKTAPPQTPEEYSQWLLPDAIHRSLQILILWEMFVLGVPLFIFAYSVRWNKALLAKAPPEAVGQSDSAAAFLARAVLLAPVDCVSFVWHALFRCEEPSYTRRQDTPLELQGPLFSLPQSEAPEAEDTSVACLEVTDSRATDVPETPHRATQPTTVDHKGPPAPSSSSPSAPAAAQPPIDVPIDMPAVAAEPGATPSAPAAAPDR